jgi:hypothetical protein
MRLVRFSGAAEVFWPIGMHMLLVADLMPRQVYAGPSDAPANPWMEVYGLLHDAAEVCVGDVPRPMKTAEARALEDRVQSRIYAALGVPEPTAAVTAAIKEADFRAALAEGSCGCAGRGYAETQTGFLHDKVAKEALQQYIADMAFTRDELLDANGYWPLLYESRLRAALREAQNAVSYAQAAEVSAPAAITPFRPLLDAIESLYRSQEHRPSFQAVRAVVLRALTTASWKPLGW